MAKGNGEAKAAVDAWLEAQKKLDAANKAIETARAEAQLSAKRIYELRGSEAFVVASLKKGFRAVHKKERDGKNGPLGESWVVIPLPQNAPTDTF